MEEGSEWGAGLALAFYFILLFNFIVNIILIESILSALRIGYEELSFPVALVYLPLTETVTLGVTNLFARIKGVGLSTLGLKKVDPRTLAIALILAIPLYLSGMCTSIAEGMVFGPNPQADFLRRYMTPRNPTQLVLMILYQLVLVGLCEEIAFRGFIQRGLETTLGTMKGLLAASFLFGLPHSLLSPHLFLPNFVGGLILGYIWQWSERNTTATSLLHGTNNSISIMHAYNTNF